MRSSWCCDLDDQPQQITRLLGAVYPHGVAEQPHRAALEQINTTAAALDGSPPVTFADAIELVLSDLDDQPQPIDAAANAHLLGWADALYDASPRPLISGMNEGLIPPRPPAVPFVPERLRRALGLLSAADHY